MCNCNGQIHKILLSLNSKAHGHGNNKFIDQILTQTITAGRTHAIPTWNCLIRAYSKSPTPIKAILIYNHLFKTCSPRPDNYTYPPLLKAYSRLFLPFLGKLVHTHLIKIGLDYDIYVQNSLINFYRAISEFINVHKVFDKMLKRDVVSWNTLICAYNDNCNSFTEVMGLFKKMINECGRADRISLVAVLSACAQVQKEGLDCGRAIHCYVVKVGLGWILNLNNGLSDFYIKCKQMDAASRVFDDMGSTRDVVSYTILVSGFVEMGNVDLARDVFDQIVDKDLVLWNLMIHGYVKVRRLEDALELFEAMYGEGVMPDENTMVSVLAACAGLSDLKRGRLVHLFINRNNVKQDVFVKTALIDMYSKCGSLEEALVTFYKMRYKDVFAWTTVIEGLANNGYGDEALCMLYQMEKEGIRPNDVTFVSVLTACSHSGSVEVGCQLFKRMVGVHGLQPKIEHFGCIIDLLSRAGLLDQAEEFIPFLQPEQRLVAYKILLSACIKHSEYSLGEKFAKEMKTLSSLSHETHILLSNFYALARQWNQVADTRKLMKVCNISKEPGISCV